MKNYKLVTYLITIITFTMIITNSAVQFIKFDDEVIYDQNIESSMTTSNGTVEFSKVTFDDDNYYLSSTMTIDNIFDTNEVSITSYINGENKKLSIKEGINNYSIPINKMPLQDVFNITVHDSHSSKKIGTVIYNKTNFIFIEDLTDYKEVEKSMDEMNREVKYFSYLIDKYSYLITDQLLLTYLPKENAPLEEKHKSMVQIIDLIVTKNLEYETQITAIKTSIYLEDLNYYLTPEELEFWKNLGTKNDVLNYFDYVTVIKKLPSVLKQMISDQEIILVESNKVTNEELDVKDEELSDIDYYIYLKTLNS